MTYLLDTNVVIALHNDRQSSVRAALMRARQMGESDAISTVSLHELWYGVARSSRYAQNAEALRKVLATGIEILNFDSEDAIAAASIRADLAKIGKPIGPYDVLIAGQAVRRNATLVTANEKEFARVPGLKWENWSLSKA